MERILTSFHAIGVATDSDIDHFTRLTVLLPYSNVDTYSNILFRDLRIPAFSFPFQIYDAIMP